MLKRRISFPGGHLSSLTRTEINATLLFVCNGYLGYKASCEPKPFSFFMMLECWSAHSLQQTRTARLTSCRTSSVSGVSLFSFLLAVATVLLVKLATASVPGTNHSWSQIRLRVKCLWFILSSVELLQVLLKGYCCNILQSSVAIVYKTLELLQVVVIITKVVSEG